MSMDIQEALKVLGPGRFDRSVYYSTGSRIGSTVTSETMDVRRLTEAQAEAIAYALNFAARVAPKIEALGEATTARCAVEDELVAALKTGDVEHAHAVSEKHLGFNYQTERDAARALVAAAKETK